MSTRAPSDDLFLPDFCNVRIVLAVVIIAELLAFTLTLATTNASWGQLSLTSLFIQWIALSSAALLCLIRTRLTHLKNETAAIISFTLLLLVTALFSELALWIISTPGDNTLLPQPDHLDFLLRNLAISAITSFIALRYFYLQHQLRQNIKAEAEARIQALHARIRPHFLFNSLNSIVSLIRHHPELAERAVEDLADLFRMTLKDAHSTLPMESELELSRQYLRIEKLRLGERLKMVWEIDTLPRDAEIPALTLQPLLENAIGHGIALLPEGGTIHCSGKLTKGEIQLNIKNPTDDRANAQQKGHQLALNNIRQRLNLHFEGEAKLYLTKKVNYYEVEIRFPYRGCTEGGEA